MPPLPIPKSIRRRVIEAMAAALAPASITTARGAVYARPTGLVVHRYRFRPSEDGLAAVVKIADDPEAEQVSASTAAPLLLSSLLVETVVRATSQEAPEDATDEVLTWVDLCYEADTTLGGLVLDVIPAVRAWEAKAGSASNESAASVTHLVRFHTLRSDPTLNA